MDERQRERELMEEYLKQRGWSYHALGQYPFNQLVVIYRMAVEREENRYRG